jgi:hypothetical protein
MIVGRKGGLHDARLFHHCNRRHHGGGRTWRVLLASPAGGADATSEIAEDLNLSNSQLPAPSPPAGASSCATNTAWAGPVDASYATALYASSFLINEGET